MIKRKMLTIKWHSSSNIPHSQRRQLRQILQKHQWKECAKAVSDY